MTWSNLSQHFLSIVALMVLSLKVDAQSLVDAEIDTGVDTYASQVEAECYIRVGEDEPYIAFNGDCRLYKSTVAVAVLPIQGHPIPYPRNEDWVSFFYAIDWGVPPVNDTVYCASFGWQEGGPGSQFFVILAHETDSNENYYMPESRKCTTYSPPPTVWCYDPPLFLGCPYGCMSSPYLMQWGGQNASSFVVQKSGFSGWGNWYSGPNTSSFASTGTIYHEYFRVKAVNVSGSSSWCYMTLYVQCSEEMDPW